MIRTFLARAGLAIALAISIPAAAVAQEPAATPEGIDWHLTAYADDGGLTAVPWSVDATLLLEDGTASGSNGCNQFSGDYDLVGDSLTFGSTLGVTLMACVGDHATVEAGCMAALPNVASWAVENDVLQLSDADGVVVLELAEPIVGLTESDIAALQALLEAQRADIDRLEERLGNVRIGTLRERLRALEAETKRLRATQASSSAPNSGGSTFTAAEKVLREAIPASIRSTCVPRRSDNPFGTVAAVQCTPSASIVRDMAYYLMESGPATAVWEARMNQYNVKDGPGSCRKGKKDKVYYTPGPNADGCYVNADGRANLRYLAAATSCKQLDAGNTHLKRPTLYIAVLGTGKNLAALTKWAEPDKYGGPDTLYKPIKRPNEAHSPMCPGS